MSVRIDRERLRVRIDPVSEGGDRGREGGRLRKGDVRLPGKRNSFSHGARPVYQKHLDDQRDSDR